MASLRMVPIRCLISLGGITAGTPVGSRTNHVLSFNVDKVRGQPGTCNVSLRVKKGQASMASSTGGVITIDAGANGANHRVFYGFIKSITISPCREYPSFVIMNATGIDVLSKLDGKKYTRRCRYAHGTWISIEGVVREGLRSSKLLWLPNEPYLEFNGGKLNKQDTLSKTRGTSQPTAFEKMTTNSVDMVPMMVGAYTTSPDATSQQPAQTQP
jgi:hypothetical protein